MGKMFRLLKANEIDCRIGMVKEKGCTILLYKDARVDQTVLDETVGPMNWQRSHSRDNANCTVSIWDDKKTQWISKEDTGTESFTEKEKGLASDSFKRACFNWGIGRELYSAPFIWIPSTKCSITGNGGKFKTFDSFTVSRIEYDQEGNIALLDITNDNTRNVAYSFSAKPKTQQKEQPKAQPKTQEKIDPAKEIRDLCKKADRTEEYVCNAMKVHYIEEMDEKMMNTAKVALLKIINGGSK